MNKLFITMSALGFLLAPQSQASLITDQQVFCAKNQNTNLDMLIAKCLRAGAPVVDCEIDPLIRMVSIKKQCKLSVEGCKYLAELLAPVLGIPVQDIDQLKAGCDPEATRLSGGDEDEGEILGDYDLEELLSHRW